MAFNRNANRAVPRAVELFAAALSANGYPLWVGGREAGAAELAAAGEAVTFCPLHESEGAHDPSLTVTISPDCGRVLTYCHACQESPYVAIISGQVPDCEAEYAPKPHGGGGGGGGSANWRTPGEKPARQDRQRKRMAAIEIRTEEDYNRWCSQQAAGGLADVATYFYGARLAKVKFSDKEFWWFHREPWGWVPGQGGQTPPLYGAESIPEGGGAVWAVEGEKDADLVRSWGLAAVSTAEAPGALGALAGRAVIIVPDNDKAGAAKAERFAAAAELAGAASVTVLEPLGSGPGYDVSDWAAGGGDRAALEALAESGRGADQGVCGKGEGKTYTTNSQVRARTFAWLRPLSKPVEGAAKVEARMRAWASTHPNSIDWKHPECPVGALSACTDAARRIMARGPLPLSDLPELADPVVAEWALRNAPVFTIGGDGLVRVLGQPRMPRKPQTDQDLYPGCPEGANPKDGAYWTAEEKRAAVAEAVRLHQDQELDARDLAAIVNRETRPPGKRYMHIETVRATLRELITNKRTAPATKTAPKRVVRLHLADDMRVHVSKTPQAYVRNFMWTSTPPAYRVGPPPKGPKMRKFTMADMQSAHPEAMAWIASLQTRKGAHDMTRESAVRGGRC